MNAENRDFGKIIGESNTYTYIHTSVHYKQAFM